jgi:hypothetical protein
VKLPAGTDVLTATQTIATGVTSGASAGYTVVVPLSSH